MTDYESDWTPPPSVRKAPVISFEALLHLERSNPEGLDYGGMIVEIPVGTIMTGPIHIKGRNLSIRGGPPMLPFEYGKPFAGREEEPFKDKFPYGKG